MILSKILSYNSNPVHYFTLVHIQYHTYAPIDVPLRNVITSHTSEKVEDMAWYNLLAYLSFDLYVMLYNVGDLGSEI